MSNKNLRQPSFAALSTRGTLLVGIAVFLWLGLGTSATAMAAEKQLMSSDEVTQSPQTPPSTEKKAEKKTEKKSASGEDGKADLETDKSKNTATFVDKDGDGINDGKEHRFRNKSASKSKRYQRKLLRKGRSQKSSSGKNAPLRKLR